MKEIVSRLHENRQIQLAKSILENAGYKVEKMNESIEADYALLKRHTGISFSKDLPPALESSQDIQKYLSKEDYKRLLLLCKKKKVFHSSGCRSLEDYHEYLSTQILPLLSTEAISNIFTSIDLDDLDYIFYHDNSEITGCRDSEYALLKSMTIIPVEEFVKSREEESETHASTHSYYPISGIKEGTGLIDRDTCFEILNVSEDELTYRDMKIISIPVIQGNILVSDDKKYSAAYGEYSDMRRAAESKLLSLYDDPEFHKSALKSLYKIDYSEAAYFSDVLSSMDDDEDKKEFEESIRSLIPKGELYYMDDGSGEYPEAMHLIDSIMRKSKKIKGAGDFSLRKSPAGELFITGNTEGLYQRLIPVNPITQ